MDVEPGRMLPAAAYLDEDVLAWELDAFFARRWLCVGRSEELPDPGDQRGVRAGSEGLVVVRDRDGALGAYYNVCRHRASELVEVGSSTSKAVLRCPYHAWTYGLDGRLLAAPRSGLDVAAGEGGDLVPVPVVDWRGWILVDASGGEAGPLGDAVADLDEVVAPYRTEDLVVGARHIYEVAANWKVLVENYHECYHCSNIHPELCRVSPPESGVGLSGTGAWVGGPMALAEEAETMSLDGRSGGAPINGLDAEQRRVVQYLQLFPNLLLSLHPDYVMTHRIEPLAPGRSRVECSWLFPAEVVAGAAFDPGWATDFWDVTNRQDWAACESVQRGVASRGYRPGPLTEREGDVARFVAMVADGYAAAGLGRR